MVERRDWPQEIRKPHVYGNFRPTPTQRVQALRARSQWRQERPGMSEAHLELIRKLPCTVCEAMARQCHHLKSLAARKERGVYLKATDKWAVSICSFHHSDLERLGSRNEVAWFAKWGIDPHELADALWHGTGDQARMGAILKAHKQAAIRRLSREAAVGALMRHGLTRAEAEEQYDFTRRS